MTKILKIKIEIPQTKTSKWKYAVALAGRKGGAYRLTSTKTAVSVFRKVENKAAKHFSTVYSPVLLAVYVKDGSYHIAGDYTDFKSAFYALTCFLEDYLPQGFKDTRYKRYFTGI